MQAIPNGNMNKLCPIEINTPNASNLSRELYFRQISKLLGYREGSEQLVEVFCKK